jgi:hypothetical protein
MDFWTVKDIAEQSVGSAVFSTLPNPPQLSLWIIRISWSFPLPMIRPAKRSIQTLRTNQPLNRERRSAYMTGF